MINPLIIPILGICCGLLAIFGGVVVRPWIKFKERQMELQATMTAEKAAQYASHVERLESRVRVLERGAWFLSTTHDELVIDETLAAVAEAAAEV